MISFISFIHSFIHSFQLVYISHYVFFILVQMQFDTRFVFVMAPFSSRYSVGLFNFYMVYFKLRFQFATYFSPALIAGFTLSFLFAGLTSHLDVLFLEGFQRVIVSRFSVLIFWILISVIPKHFKNTSLDGGSCSLFSQF